jgi:tetratricopeptide (TPR) repeat protein
MRSDFNARFQKAIKAGRDRDYPRAVELLEGIIAETDEFPEAVLYLGRGYHALGRWEEALQAFRTFIRLQPDTSAGYFFAGRVLLTLDLPSQAYRYLKKAHELNPEESSILGLLGISCLKIRRPDLASTVLGRAVELDPGNRKLYTGYLNALSVHAVREFYAGNLDLAEQMFTFLVENGDHGVMAYLYLGAIHREFGRYPEALESYERAVGLSPEDPLIRLSRAELLYLTGNREEAVRELERLKTRLPGLKDFSFDDYTYNRFLAIHYFQEGNSRNALYYSKRALAANYSDPDLHLLVGECLRQSGQLNKASNHFHRVIDVDRNNTGALYGLSLVLWQREEFAQMLKYLKRLLKDDPRDSTALYYATLCRCRLDEDPETLLPEVQERIHEMGPDPHLLVCLAEQYRKNGIGELSEKWYRKAIDMDTEYRTAYLGLIDLLDSREETEPLLHIYGRYFEVFPGDSDRRKDFIQLLVDTGDYDRAADQIVRFIPYGGTDEASQRLLAICYRKTKQYKDAIVVYSQLLRLHPKNEEYLKGLVYCYDKTRRRDRSILLLEKGLEYIKDPSPSLLLIYGVLLHKSDENERALSVFRRIVDTYPEDWRGYWNMGRVYEKMGVAEMAKKLKTRAESLKNSKK